MSPRRHRPNRTITIVAVGFLVLDGVLLLIAGWWSGRPGLLAMGGVFCAAAAGVVVYWRRYLRQLRELNAGLEARFRELQALEREFGDGRG